MSIVLVTGGTGKTGRRVVARLQAAGVPVRVGSRAAAIPFEWSDPSTFDAVLDEVSAVYLVAPTGADDVLAAMGPFLERALARGVGRFVLLSASSLPRGGPMMGAVHAFLAERAPSWVVLRPTWFMQNFSEQHHQATIRDEGVIASATGGGRIAFVDVDDIAAVAVEALTRPEFPSGDLIVTGPERLSYADVAAAIAAAAGIVVRHDRITEAALAAAHERRGMPAVYAATLAAMDTAIAAGAEDRTTATVREVTGRPPRSFAAFAAAARDAWRPGPEEG